MSTIQLHDKKFKPYIPFSQIEASVKGVAAKINHDYRNKENPIFLGVLNGSFMFMAELLKNIEFNCETSFVKIASYRGTSSTGNVTEIIGLADNIKGRHVIIVEDIVDTGNSIEHLMRSLVGHEPASIAVATLLFKPDAYKKDIHLDYWAMSIPNDFIVGFGLDYNQLGRNLNDIYVLDEE